MIWSQSNQFLWNSLHSPQMSFFFKAQTRMDGSNIAYARANMSSSSAFVHLSSADYNERPSTSLSWFYCRRKFGRNVSAKANGRVYDILRRLNFTIQKSFKIVSDHYSAKSMIYKLNIREIGENSRSRIRILILKKFCMCIIGVRQAWIENVIGMTNLSNENSTSKTQPRYVLCTSFYFLATVYMSFIRVHALFDLSPLRLTLRFVSNC